MMLNDQGPDHALFAGYILGTVTGSACLQIVHELASVTLRDSYPAKDPPALHSGVMVCMLHGS